MLMLMLMLMLVLVLSRIIAGICIDYNAKRPSFRMASRFI